MKKKKPTQKQLNYFVNRFLTSQSAWFLPQTGKTKLQNSMYIPGAHVPKQTDPGIKYCIVCGQGSHRVDWVGVKYPMCDNHTDEDFIRSKLTGWFKLLQGGHYMSDSNIVPPDDMPKLVFTRDVYNDLPEAKKRILFKLKKQAASQSVDVSATEIIWYLDPEVFLEMTTEFPWLLDKNLGETEVDVDDLWGKLP